MALQYQRSASGAGGTVKRTHHSAGHQRQIASVAVRSGMAGVRATSSAVKRPVLADHSLPSPG
jgi:hypothetical protein